MAKRTGRPTTPLDQRIRDSVEIDGSGCWVWQKGKSAGGYGFVSVGSRKDDTRRTRYAHRAAYEVFVAPITEGQVVDHKCRNRACVNPEHLEAVSPTLNAIRRSAANSGYRVCPKGHRQPDGAVGCKPCRGELFDL